MAAELDDVKVGIDDHAGWGIAREQQSVSLPLGFQTRARSGQGW